MAQRRGRKGQKVRTVLMACAVVCVAGVSAMLYMRQKVTETYADDDGSTAQSEVVETGSLSTTVSGSGTLEAVGLTEVAVPADVEVGKIYYAQGSEISEGDLLFSVDNASVLKAMKETQNQIDTLDASLEEASADEVSSALTSGVSGRVKKIYAAAEDDVSSVMYNSGALMTLSLDGYMAVDVQTDLLSEGDSVTVTTSDDVEYTGTVDSADGQTAVVLITDDGPAVGDSVTVTFETGDGKEQFLPGTLYIHSPLSITGYAGTVESVDVAENELIYADTSLLTLTDTSYSANYDAILSQREVLEETLNELIVLYREGGVYAPISGKISSIEEVYADYVEDASEDGTSQGSDDSAGESGTSAQAATAAQSGTSAQTTTAAQSGTSAQTTTAAQSGTSAQATISTQQSDMTGSGDTSEASQSADAGQSGTTGSGENESESVVLTLDPNEEMTVGVSVDETDILTMKTGQSASITIDSIGEDVYTGTVTDIDTSASSSSGVTTYTVEVTIPRAEKMLSGMSADVEIQVDGVENAILVPSEAVHQTSSTSYVYTTYDEETKEFGGMTEVTTGLTDGSKTEITSGLKAGDTIWYEEAEETQTSGFPGMGGERGQMDFGNMGQGGNSSQGSGSRQRSGSGSSNRPGGSSGNGGGPAGG